jgi:hypothetical protein
MNGPWPEWRGTNQWAVARSGWMLTEKPYEWMSTPKIDFTFLGNVVNAKKKKKKHTKARSPSRALD